MQGQREVRRELNIFSIRMTAERLWDCDAVTSRS